MSEDANDLIEKLEDILDVTENKDVKLLIKTLVRHLKKNKKMGF